VSQPLLLTTLETSVTSSTSSDVAMAETEDTALLGDVLVERADPGWSERQQLECEGVGLPNAVSADTAILGRCVFARAESQWELEHVLEPDPPVTAEELDDEDVALSGETALLGIPSDGAVYVFVRTESGWIQEARLVADDATPSFGRAVALDGDTALIGAEEAVFVFERVAGTWQPAAKLTASDTDIPFGEPWGFGRKVALSGDFAMSTVVVELWAGGTSATWADEPQDGEGARIGALVFARSGSAWSHQAWLESSWTMGSWIPHVLTLDDEIAVVGENWYAFQCPDWKAMEVSWGDFHFNAWSAPAGSLRGSSFAVSQGNDGDLGGPPPDQAYIATIQGRPGDGCSIDGDCGVGRCVDGQCVNPTMCNDDNPCTLDDCHPATGCAFEPVADGTPCPEGQCLAGICVDAPPPDSGDGGGAATAPEPNAPDAESCSCTTPGTSRKALPSLAGLLLLGLTLARRRG
jgi:hypothetical protein